MSRTADFSESLVTSTHRGLDIPIVSGTGSGSTKLAAFDAALRAAGIADFNLIYLSSIIPPGTRIRRGGPALAPDAEVGDRLYVVMAQLRVEHHNEEAHAGIGWAQDRKTGRGIFVEHVGHSESQVRRDLMATLDDLTSARSDTFGPPEHVITSAVCTDEPVCALVAGVYAAEGWPPGETIDLR